MLWLLDPVFQPVLKDFSIYLRISKSHRSSSYRNVAVHTLAESIPSISTVNVAGTAVTRQAIRVKLKTIHGLEKLEDVDFSDLVLHEPKVKAPALVVSGDRRGQLLFVQRFDREDKTKCWCRPIDSNCRVKHFCVSVSDVTKVGQRTE